MPLAFEVNDPLEIPPTCFNADGVAAVIAHGARSGGAWNIGAIVDGQRLGEIDTVADPRPSMAVDTAYVWIHGECQRLGLKIVGFENLNSQIPADQAPYVAIGQFLIVDKDWT